MTGARAPSVSLLLACFFFLILSLKKRPTPLQEGGRSGLVSLFFFPLSLLSLSVCFLPPLPPPKNALVFDLFGYVFVRLFVLFPPQPHPVAKHPYIKKAYPSKKRRSSKKSLFCPLPPPSLPLLHTPSPLFLPLFSICNKNNLPSLSISKITAPPPSPHPPPPPPPPHPPPPPDPPPPPPAASPPATAP